MLNIIISFVDHETITMGWIEFEEKKNVFRIHSGELKDEDGVLLGGKKASIQFAHDLKNEAKDDSAEILGVTTSPASD